ncbi:hypothetical protein ANOM_004103 [Aspergillus nomiae NRRL 13137]|uniref:Arrestin (Or S-antigen), N-terminal domain protein n=1 Tax=Aspergillus nomiae NRRL (strain ATCC 15546 / NRRL 13137 / CBS 260.88 / M93) TaxID=1509407 RepID=A0A0L1J8Q0_ASPN3|nr:uncharacterized protein ANOM_004103 [Aspergillus nomiae NRRL 13137]KNG88055.1 hypothetical protein ANOM_004103 [Aspergillus nomiae NRRL 13137]
MEPLHLDVPTTHHVYEGSHGERYSPPISGSVLVPVSLLDFEQAEYPNVTVSLLRTVTLRDNELASNSQNDNKKGDFLQRIRRKRVPQTQTITTQQKEGSSTVEALVQCTTETPFGGLSYAVRAAATFPSGVAVDATKDVQILSQIVTGPSQTVRHFKKYTGERLQSELSLTPEQPTDPKAKLAYSAKLVARGTTARGARPTERKQFFVREVQWSVEETVKLMKVSGGENPDGESITWKEQSVRQLCSGKQQGRWAPNKKLSAQQRKLHEDHDRIDVQFNITIPRSASTADRPDLSSCTFDSGKPCRHVTPCKFNEECAESRGERTTIMVDHRLRVHLIAGEDTLDDKTGDLINRRQFAKAFTTCYTLPIHEVAGRNAIPEGTFHGNSAPPLYEGESAMPPAYDFDAQYTPPCYV